MLRGLELDRHGLRWRHAPDVLAHLLPDGRAAVLNRDLDATAASLEQFAPGDGERWRHAYDDWRRRRPSRCSTRCSPPFPPVRGGRSACCAGCGSAARCGWPAGSCVPVRKLGDELFAGEGARLLLAGCALHTDLSPEEAGGGVYGWLLAMLGQQVGWPVPGRRRAADHRRAGAPGCSRAAAGSSTAPASTGCWSPAAGRWACAPPTARDWRARRAVLADVPAPALYLDLVGAGALPPRLVEDLAHFRWDGATLKVDWALSGAGAVDEPGGRRRRHRAPGRRPERPHPLRRATLARERDARATRSCCSGR